MTEITITAPDTLIEAVAARVAALLAMQDTTAPTHPISPYFTIPEAAEYLRCSRQRVDDLLSQRRLTRVKEGRRTLVLRSEVDEWLIRGPRR